MILILSPGAAILFIVASTSVRRLHGFVALQLAAFGHGVLTGMPAEEVLESINQDFGDTVATLVQGAGAGIAIVILGITVI